MFGDHVVLFQNGIILTLFFPVFVKNGNAVFRIDLYQIMVVTPFRITSYNVCYTKLLRLMHIDLFIQKEYELIRTKIIQRNRRATQSEKIKIVIQGFKRF